jgi:hypothetical protein
MSGNFIWLALAAGAASGLIGGLMSFRKDRWIAFLIAIGAGMLGGILSNRLLMLTEAVAPRMVLIDSNGATRAELGVSQDSAHLRLMDSSGNERVRLEAGSGSQGPCFLFKDTRDKPLVAFCVRGDHTALLDLRGPKEKLLWSSDPAESTAAGPPICSSERSHQGNASPSK